jgi:endonuclease/exonuclease/phosphatase family metal-dependent hydrolase
MAKKKGKKKISIWGYLFRIAVAIAATALVVSYISIFFNPAKLWFISLFGLYYIPIVILNVVLLSMAVVRWSASAWLPIVVLLPSIFFLRHFVNYNQQKQAYSSNSYKILTYNVGQYSSGKMDISRKECIRQISSFIQTEDPDVVCFQEFYIASPSEVKQILPQYPHKQYHLIKIRDNYYFGNLIASKRPIISKGKITFEKSTNLSIYADINFSDDTIRIYNNHLESYSLSPSSLLKKLRNGTRTISDEWKEIHAKMKTSNIKRAHQVDRVLKHIQNSEYKSVICGDFNDTPMSYTYQQLRKVSQDTFLEAGHGFSSTYSFLWPLLRIDYVLVPTDYQVQSHTTPRIRYSDHYPVITEIHKSI